MWKDIASNPISMDGDKYYTDKYKWLTLLVNTMVGNPHLFKYRKFSSYYGHVNKYFVPMAFIRYKINTVAIFDIQSEINQWLPFGLNFYP